MQQMQPLPSTTVRSSTWRTRWWSIADLAELVDEHGRLSHVRDAPSSAEISVVLPAAEEAGDEDDAEAVAIRAQQRCDQRRVERVERASGEALGLGPERRQVVDDLGAALARRAGRTRVPPQSPSGTPKSASTAVRAARRGRPRAARAPPSGSAQCSVSSDSAQRAHVGSRSLTSDRRESSDGQGDPLRVRRRRRRRGRLARLLRRRGLARRHLARPVRRRGRRAAPAQAVRALRHEDDLVHPRPLDRDLPRADRRWSSTPATRSACTATRTRTRSR